MDALTANDELFVKALREVAAEAGPDYTYPDEWREQAGEGEDGGQCRYVVNGQPACLIGRALAALGVPVAALENVEGSAAWAALGELHPTSAPVGDAANLAQERQDTGATWGEALALFEQRIAAAGLRPPPPGAPVGG